MKKIVYLLIPLLAFWVSFLRGQTVTSVFPGSCTPGSTLTLTIEATGVNLLSSTGAVLKQGGVQYLSSGYTVVSPSIVAADFNIPPSAPLGNYDVRAWPMPGYTPSMFTITAGGPGGSYGFVSGTLWDDTDLNCIIGATEPKFEDKVVEFTPGPYYALTNSSGQYGVWLPLGTYTISPPVINTWPVVCPPAGTLTVNVAAAGATYPNRNFGYDGATFIDASVLTSVYSGTVSPGQPSAMTIRVRNTSSVPTIAGTVSLNKSSFFTYSGASPAPASIAGSIYTWNVPVISALGTYEITVNGSIGAAVPLGTVVSSTVTTSTPADAVSSNNTTTISRVVNPGYFNIRVTGSYQGVSRPGFGVVQVLHFANSGIVTSPAGTAVLNMDSRMTYGSASDVPASVAGSVITWNLPAIAPGASHSISVYSTLSATTPIGALLSSPLNSTFTGDVDTTNNRMVITRTVQGSYDPNDKAVVTQNGFDGDTVIAYLDSTLTYTVRFQNTGTDTAFNIRIRDTLHPNLDAHTFTVLNASHPYSWLISGPGRVEVTFSNILLPDSNVNEPASHGWVRFRCVRKPGLTEGTIIPNSASIYFDFNAPIKTNTVESIICVNPATANFTLSGADTIWSFTSTSTGGPISYLWDFGDGTTSTVANPVHHYPGDGTYIVCLTVTDLCGFNTKCDTITICMLPATAFSSAPGTGVRKMNFTNLTPTGSSYLWDFGDGSTSTLANPSHTYAAAGDYVVCLTVTNSCGPKTLCDTISVTCTLPSTNYSSAPGSGVKQMNFTNLTPTGFSYLWDFGDGSTSTLANPSHTYAAVGDYVVCFTVTDSCGPKTHCDTITVTCILPSTNYSSAPGSGVKQMNFTNLTPTGFSYLWDFGDGSTSTLANPSHTYAAVGDYVVCFTVTDTCGPKTHCDTITVSCTLPSTNYSSAPGSGVKQMNFTNLTPTGFSYLWEFGDGSTSTLSNPSHTYAAAGAYYVCLTVTDSCGPDTYCDSVYVSCTLPSPSYTYSSGATLEEIHFTNTSPTGFAWLWTFGDGGTSTSSNPIHTYPAGPAWYYVCLTVTDSCGSSTHCDSVYVDCLMPSAGYTYTMFSAGQVFFFNGSSAGVTSYWEFGDGGTSTSANPVHIYAASGIYTVCLYATDACGTDTLCQDINVIITGNTPVEVTQQWEVWPNPAGEALFAAGGISAASGEVKLTLTDALGRKLVERTVMADGGAFRFELDMSRYAAAMYMVTLESGGVIKQFRIAHE